MAGHIIYVHDTIPAPPEWVWEVITDVGHADRVYRSVTDSELLTAGEYDVGTTWRESRTLFGHHGAEELHVLECDPPRRAVVETTLGPDVVTTAYRITPADGPSGQSARLAMTTTVHMERRSRAGNLAWDLFGGPSYARTRRLLEHDLEDIRAEAQRRAQAA